MFKVDKVKDLSCLALIGLIYSLVSCGFDDLRILEIADNIAQSPVVSENGLYYMYYIVLYCIILYIHILPNYS